MAKRTEHDHRGGPTAGRNAKGEPDHSGHGHAHDHSTHDHSAQGHPSDDTHLVKDPVCGMMVDPHTTQYKAEHVGRPYYFCSAGCREKFVAEPERYLDPAAAEKAEPV